MIFNDDIRRRDPVSDVRTLLADIVVLSNPAAVEAIDHFYRVQSVAHASVESLSHREHARLVQNRSNSIIDARPHVVPAH